MAIIVDIQALYGSAGEFLPKEIAVTATHNEHYGHWLVEPPYDFGDLPKHVRTSNNNLTCYHHGLEWVDGDTPLRKVYANLRAMCRNTLRIYTRGLQKAELLRDVLGREIINLEEFDGPSFKNMPINNTFCIHHGMLKEDRATCALNNVARIRSWINFRELNSVSPIYSQPLATSTPIKKKQATPSTTTTTTTSTNSEASNKNKKNQTIRNSCAIQTSKEYIFHDDTPAYISPDVSLIVGTEPANDEIVALFRAKDQAPTLPAKQQVPRKPTPPPRRNNKLQRRRQSLVRQQQLLPQSHEQSSAAGGAATNTCSDQRCLPSRPHTESMV